MTSLASIASSRLLRRLVVPKKAPVGDKAAFIVPFSKCPLTSNA